MRKTVLELYTLNGQGETVRTVAQWTGGSLALEMPAYYAALEPGSKFGYVADALGYIPQPVKAVLRAGSLGGKIVERWSAEGAA